MHYAITENSCITSQWRQAQIFYDRDERRTKEEKKQSLASLKFHINNNDYFGTLATILNLLAYKMKSNDKKIIENIVTDLAHLQKNCRITQKINNQSNST